MDYLISADFPSHLYKPLMCYPSGANSLETIERIDEIKDLYPEFESLGMHTQKGTKMGRSPKGDFVSRLRVRVENN